MLRGKSYKLKIQNQQKSFEHVPSWFLLFNSKSSLTDWSWLHAPAFENIHKKYSKETCTTSNIKERTIYKWHNFFILVPIRTKDKRNFMQFSDVLHPMTYERDRPVTGNTNNSKDKGLFLLSALIHPTILCLSSHLLEASSVVDVQKNLSRFAPQFPETHYIPPFMLFQPLITQPILLFAPHAQILLWDPMAKKIALSLLTWAKAVLAYKIPDYTTVMQNSNLMAHLRWWLIAPTQNVLECWYITIIIPVYHLLLGSWVCNQEHSMQNIYLF